MPRDDERNGALVLKWPGPRREARDGPDPGAVAEATEPAPAAGTESAEHDRPPAVLGAIVDEIRTVRQRQRATELVLVMFASLGPQFGAFNTMLDRMAEEADASPGAAEHPGFNEALHDVADTARTISGGDGGGQRTNKGL